MVEKFRVVHKVVGFLQVARQQCRTQVAVWQDDWTPQCPVSFHWHQCCQLVGEVALLRKWKMSKGKHRDASVASLAM